jgi:hypothetical protein
MYKYIITWIVVSIQSAPCPDARRVSEFGTMNRSSMSCAVYHTQTVKENKSREFYSKDSANVFMKNINNYKPSGFNYSIEDKIEKIQIESIKIK